MKGRNFKAADEGRSPSQGARSGRKPRLRGVLACACTASLVAALALAGCASGGSLGSSGSSGPSSASSAAEGSGVELQVYAANSLQKAMPEAMELYTEQTGVEFAEAQYKASGELNEMLGGGGYADLLITASKGTMDTAVEKGYVDEGTRTDMFANELVIVAKKGSGVKDVTLEQIAAGQYSVCVGDDSVPAGNYAAQALSTVGAYQPPAAEAGKTGKDISGKGGAYVGITPATDSSVGNVCQKAASGEVDVAIVYSSDAYRFDVEIVGNIPDSTHKAIVYPGAVTADSKQAEESAKFMEWCITDPDAQKIWNEWGFQLAQD